jgi:hypothetical protein
LKLLKFEHYIFGESQYEDLKLRTHDRDEEIVMFIRPIIPMKANGMDDDMDDEDEDEDDDRPETRR